MTLVGINVLALHTGAASETDLSRSLVWTVNRVRETLYSMRDAEIVKSNGDRWQLTPKGTEQAVWHLAHPGYLTYQPRRVK